MYGWESIEQPLDSTCGPSFHSSSNSREGGTGGFPDLHCHFEYLFSRKISVCSDLIHVGAAELVDCKPTRLSQVVQQHQQCCRLGVATILGRRVGIDKQQHLPSVATLSRVSRGPPVLAGAPGVSSTTFDPSCSLHVVAGPCPRSP